MTLWSWAGAREGPARLEQDLTKRLNITVAEHIPVDRKVRMLDSMVSVIALVYPITGIPQVAKIWMEKSSAGISLMSWTLFFAFTLVLVAYALTKKDRRLALLWGLWLFIYVAVIAGALVYG